MASHRNNFLSVSSSDEPPVKKSKGSDDEVIKIKQKKEKRSKSPLKERKKETEVIVEVIFCFVVFGN